MTRFRAALCAGVGLTLCSAPMAFGQTGLTGNWVVRAPQQDGTTRTTYFSLTQYGAAEPITGGIRSAGNYSVIVSSTGGPAGFSISAAPIQAGAPGTRRILYEGKLSGDTLQLTTRRGPQAQPTQLVAMRAAAGEGALPARIAPPARHSVTDNGLARTPPMGWNSWNKFAGRVDDASVRGMADAMVSSGMRDAGYVYINIDDTWEGGRDAQGNILTNKKFPDMKALADYVHGKGLKLGIYSGPGLATCAGYEGSYGHEEQDAKTYAAWGIDYLKYDWCSAATFYADSEMPAVYQKMGDALRATGRPIVYSLCQYGRVNVWRWGADVGGNLWRTTGDISDRWDSMSRIGFAQDTLGPFAASGHVNDPDMLEIGNGGMTDDEYKTHMSLWSMLAAPLLAGNDLRAMTPNIAAILMNRDVIAIDQDPDGKQGRRAWVYDNVEAWVRPLHDGAYAVAIFNRGPAPNYPVTLKWSDLKLPAGLRHARDLWAHKDADVGDSYSTTVPTHGVVMLRLTK